ncbi:MAG: M28 family peptidase [bacterium]|nr:M28 family peptidase [bacterium]
MPHTALAHHLPSFALMLLVTLGSAAGQGTQDLQTPPPSRELLLELTAEARLAGTSGSLRSAEMVARVLRDAGWSVEIDEREVLLSLPRKLEIAFHESAAAESPFHERIERFDADAIPPGDVPPFNAWSASGEVSAQVVDAGYGTRKDFESLLAARIDVTGKIALCRYGKGYRGVKVDLATEYGCAGVLLFSDPAGDGAERGATWPQGPWKPAWDAQRGSISPMGRTPGDPSTPGFASPAPGRRADPPRLNGEALEQALPTIPCMPIGAAEAELLRSRLTARRVAAPDGKKKTLRVGPGPVVATLVVDAPRTVRTIRNVIGRLPGTDSALVIAGNHRDAWVRGGNDAGGGTVSLLRAAQHLGERVNTGWTPPCNLALAFWDAEEFGLIGSTEWAEANADALTRDLVCYINADAAVSGTKFRASGTPGLEAVLARALGRIPWPSPPEDEALFGKTLLDQWMDSTNRAPHLGLPGSGSDFAVFLHHLALPVIDFSFTGNSGGQYHTAYDGFLVVERHLDPGFVGHETAGHFLAALLDELATARRLAVNDAWAATVLEGKARESTEWLGKERSERLATAFKTLSRAVSLSWLEWQKVVKFEGNASFGPLGNWPAFLTDLQNESNAAALAEVHADASIPPQLYSALANPEGLADRAWFRNELWTPAIESGYGSETFPRLRAAAGDESRILREMDALVERIDELRIAWDERRQELRAGK